MRGISGGWKKGVLNGGRDAGFVEPAARLPVLLGWLASPGRDDWLVGSQGVFSFLRPP